MNLWLQIYIFSWSYIIWDVSYFWNSDGAGQSYHSPAWRLYIWGNERYSSSLSLASLLPSWKDKVFIHLLQHAEVFPELTSLALQLVQPDPTRRPCAVEILAHPLFLLEWSTDPLTDRRLPALSTLSFCMVDGWINGWMDGWMDGCHISVKVAGIIVVFVFYCKVM